MAMHARRCRNAFRSCTPRVEQLEERTMLDGAALNAAFSNTGSVFTDFDGNFDRAWAAAFQPADGRIVVAGESSFGTPSEAFFALARYLPDGSLDTTFGTDGQVFTDVGGSDVGARDVIIQPNGQILVVGEGVDTEQLDFALVRYNSDGTLDNTFGAGGITFTDFDPAGASDDTARSVDIDSQGRIIVVGQGGPAGNVAIARYLADGSLDTTFGTNGLVNTDAGFGGGIGLEVFVNPNDTFYVAVPTLTFGGNLAPTVFRFLADGTLDPNFGDGGFTVLGNSAPIQPESYGLTVDGTGRILVAGTQDFGTADTNGFVARLTTTGDFDTTFGNSGVTQIDSAAHDFVRVNDIHLQPDGDIFFTGQAVAAGLSDTFFGRLNSDGSLDTTFTTNGLLVCDFGGNDQLFDLAAAQDGQLVGVGIGQENLPNFDFLLVGVAGGTAPPAGAVISGQKFLDIDADGVRDPGEPGLDDWVMQLIDAGGSVVAQQVTASVDLNNDGAIDPETESGLYTFDGLEAGTYTVGEVLQPGWRQTTPRELTLDRQSYVLGGRASPAGSAEPIRFADINGDGSQDMIILLIDGTINFRFGNGDGTFGRLITPTLPAGLQGRADQIAVADFDNDGDVDIVGFINIPDAVAYFPLRNAGNATFTFRNVGPSLPRFSGLTNLTFSTVGDFDQDGDTDIVGLFRDSSGNSVLRMIPTQILNSGSSPSFGFDQSISIGTVRGGGRIGSVVDTDVDGDTFTEIAFTTRNFYGASIRQFDTAIGGFRATQTIGNFDLAAGLPLLVAGDFDGDGDTDLFFDRQFSVGGPRGYATSVNDGSTFSDPGTLIPIDFFPRDLASADVNRDGFDDILRTTSESTVSLLLSNGDGTFGPPQRLSFFRSFPSSVVSVDLNNDGVQDFATVTSDSVSVFINRTDRPPRFAVDENAVIENIDFGNTGPVQLVSGVEDALTAIEDSLLDIPVEYTVSNNDNSLSGIGLRLHFDSTFMSFDSINNAFPDSLVRQQVLNDTENLDDDISTDQYLLVSWVDQSGSWPRTTLPQLLFNARFQLAPASDAAATTTVRFTESSTADGYDFLGLPIDVEVVAPSLDVDDNGVADALTDGVLIIRSLFGHTGGSLTTGGVAQDAARTDPGELQRYLQQMRASILDVDLNGQIDALSDGVLIIRYLFGFRGDDLVEGVADPTGLRADPDDIVAFLDGLNPNPPTVIAPDDGPPAALAGGTQIVQLTGSSDEIASGGFFSLTAAYETDPAMQPLPGLGLRLHYNSAALAPYRRGRPIQSLLQDGSPRVQELDDVGDFDDDPTTDKYILLSYFDPFSDWPVANQSGVTLLDTLFRAQAGFIGQTNINISSAASPLGYTLGPQPFQLTIRDPRVNEWNSDNDGDWEDGNNWSSGEAPRSGDFAIIDRPGADVNVRFNSADAFVGGLTSRENLVIQSGSLTIGQQFGPAQVNGLQILSGGTLIVDSTHLEVSGPGGVTNRGNLTILGGSLLLSEDALLTNQFGGLLSIDVSGGGVPGEELAGGGVPGLPIPGGGVPGLISNGGLIVNQNGATIEVLSGSVTLNDPDPDDLIGPCEFENFGILRINDGSLLVTLDAEFGNFPGGLVEINVSGGGVPGEELFGGGVPGVTILGGSIFNQNGAAFSLTGSGLSLSENGLFSNEAGSEFNIDVSSTGVPGMPTPGGGVPGLPVLLDQGSMLNNQVGAALNLGNSPVNVTNSSTLNNSGNLTTTGGLNLLNAMLTGIGTVNANVYNSGIVSPGLSPGQLTINGDYFQFFDGVLILEVGGSSAGDEHDQLQVLGLTILDGEVNLAFINDYTPGPDDNLIFLNSENVGGNFANTNVTGAEGFTIGVGNPIEGLNIVAVQIDPDNPEAAGFAGFMQSLYLDLLGRSAEMGGFIFWINQLNSGMSRTDIAIEFVNSAEYRTNSINELYMTYLDRPVDDTGLQFFLGLVDAGVSYQQIASFLAASPEYYQLNGATDEGFLISLYDDSLDRPIEEDELNAGLNGLQNGAARSEIIDALFAGDEFQELQINDIYFDLLGRPSDEEGLAFWTGQMFNGMLDAQVIAFIVGSEEYFAP